MMSWRHRNVVLNFFRLFLFLSEKKKGKEIKYWPGKKKGGRGSTLSVSFTTSYTEDEPDFRPRKNLILQK